MPKLLCTKCEVQLIPEMNGVPVIEHAEFGPYKLWQADLWKCPNCGLEIVAGFCQEPMEHYIPGFQERLQRYEAYAQHYYDYENQEQRHGFKAAHQ